MDREVSKLIREMSSANPLWGAPRIHGELLKLGIETSQATVAKYMVRRRGTPSPTWRSFLRNQAAGIAAIDMFVVASVSFRLLYVMIILAHDRRKIIHTAVTEHPTAAWLSRQVTEAFPWDTAPRYLLRDRDASYGQHFRKRVDAMGIKEVVTAPRSPWQNAYVERVIGSIRRECLDHIVIFNERHLRRILSSYVDYYHRTRTHLSLDKDCPTHARLCHAKSEMSSPSRKSVACITATNGSLPDSDHLPAINHARSPYPSFEVSVSKAFDLELESNCDSARSPFHFFSSIRWQFSPTDQFTVPSQFSVATATARWLPRNLRKAAPPLMCIDARKSKVIARSATEFVHNSVSIGLLRIDNLAPCRLPRPRCTVARAPRAGPTPEPEPG